MNRLSPKLALPGRHRLPEIRQAEAAECGLACLAMVIGFHGRRLDLNALRREHPISLKGVTLTTLMGMAGRLGLVGRPLRLEVPHLRELRVPAILHWDMSHFVVLKRVDRRGVVVHDPALGVRRYTLAEVSKHFTGVALELSPDPDRTTSATAARSRGRSLFDFLGPLGSFAPALVQVLVVSVVMQLYVLASPFYMQLVVDDAVARADPDLVLVLALGFGLLLLINTGATLLRSRILQYVQSALAFQMGAGLFTHLLRLPLAYFEKRHVGDLVSRFGSIEPIRNLLAEGLIAATVDGAMALLTAAMIFLYSPALAWVVVAALLAYLGLRLAFYRLLRRRLLDLVVAKARESTTFIETVRAVQSIKLFGRETERGAVWMNRYADVMQADTTVTWLKQVFRVLNDLIFGLEHLVVIYLGAHAALVGEMTVGMLFAFVAYKQQFVDKATRLVEKAIEFRMLDLHLERLADITETEPERGHVRPDAYLPPLQGNIEVRNLSFRYAEGEPYIFEKVSFAVHAGDYVAITGPSGGGKTTLVKVLLGLLEPTSGEVLVDGMPLSVIGPDAFRRNVGVVMQDDQLLSGSIADNICFFDEAFDIEHMQQCAVLAGIHDEIICMPMAYNSLVGDMGTSLSGGQKQRVLLARALYRRPHILVMDEGTSHLDVVMEQRVTAAVKNLGLTRLVIAHRPETIASAERRLILDPTGVRELQGVSQ